MNISRKQLLKKLLKVKDTKQVGLTYVKQHKIPAVGVVVAEIRAVGYINADYARAVKRKTGKTIKPMKRSWGERIEGTPVIENKGKHYLEVKIIRKSDPVYYINGKVVTDAGIISAITIDLLAVPDREEAVKIRTFSKENVTRLTLSGVVYNLR